MPDPANPELSISMRYKHTKSEPSMSSPSDAMRESLTSQLVDEHTLKMSHWVPTAQFSCVYSNKSQQVSKKKNFMGVGYKPSYNTLIENEFAAFRMCFSWLKILYTGNIPGLQ